MGITEETQRVISLCTGIRGLERGLELAGIKVRTVVNVDIEAFVCENLAQEMDFGFLDEAPIWTNLKTFDGRPFRGLVDGITGGYPCQPFSTAGRRQGKLDPRHLWPFIGGNRDNIIRAVAPLWCFFENVPGHLSLGYQEVRENLQGIGYAVEEGIFSAKETGASHLRERLFILAIRKDFLDYSIDRRPVSNDKVYSRRNSIDHAGNRELGHPQGVHVQGCAQRPWQIQSWGAGHCLSDTNFNGTVEIKNAEQYSPKTVQSESCNISDLANPNDNGNGSQRTEIERAGETIEGKEQRQKRDKKVGQRMRTEPCNRCVHRLAYSNVWRQQQRGNERVGRIKESVAKRGERQHVWESPRAIVTEESARLLGGYSKRHPESFPQEQIDQVAFDGFTGKVKPHLDSTVDGYDFRKDFLRALGNSVYEDSAALAFITLLKKHGLI